jgi:hypothetical protein
MFELRQHDIDMVIPEPSGSLAKGNEAAAVALALLNYPAVADDDGKCYRTGR